MNVGVLEIQMLANMARLAKDMDDAKRTVSSAMGNIEKVVGQAKTALGALGIGLSADYFINFIRGGVDALDHLNDLTKSTDQTVETLSGLQLLAKQTGSDLEGTAAAVNKLSVNMGQNAEKYAQLGVTAKDPLEAFKQLADVFAALDDPQLRSSMAAEALGKSWAGAAPALAEGSQRIGEMVERGRRLSGVTQENAERADQFNDQLAELNILVGAVKMRMVGDMLPALNETTRAITLAYEESGKLRAIWVALGALGAFAFTDEFASASVKITALKEKLEALERDRETAEKMPAVGIVSRWLFGTGKNDAEIERVRREIAALQAEMDRPAKKQAADKEAAAAAAAKAKAFADAEENARKAKEAAQKAANAYEDLIKSIREKTAENNIEIAVGASATESDKLRIKYLVELGTKYQGLSTHQRAQIALELDALQVTEKRIAQTKRNAEAAQADLELSQEVEEVMRKRAIATEEVGLAVYRSVQALEDETYTLTHNIAAVREHNAERELERLGLSKSSDEWERYKKRIIDATVARDDAEKFKGQQKEIWRSVETTAHDSFINLWKGSRDVFTRISDMIENTLLEVLYQLTIKKWIIQIEQQVSTTGGGLPGAGASGGGGILQAIGNSIGNLFGGNSGFGTGNSYGNQDYGAFFANGGDHSGGWRVVGERGPELEATGPSRIFNAQQTRDILAGDGGGVQISMPVTVAIQGNADDGVIRRALQEMEGRIYKNVPSVIRAAQLRNRTTPNV